MFEGVNKGLTALSAAPVFPDLWSPWEAPPPGTRVGSGRPPQIHTWILTDFAEG